MRSDRTAPIVLGSIAFVLATPALLGVVWAQMPTPPVTPATPPVTSTTPAADGGGVATAVVLVVALILAIGIAVKLFDLRRKREADAVHLQAQISDALLRDERLFGLAVTPTASVPFWTGSPARVELTGEVPSEEHWRAVLLITEQEAARIRPDVVIEDHLRLPAQARAA